MKIRKRVSFRAAVSVLMAVLTGVFLWAGLPVLAADTIFGASGQNMRPIAENQSFNTFRNIPVHGQLTAMDPEGDALSFEVAVQPKLGAVKADKDGRFVYTPDENRKGKDTFSFVAVDAAGNISDKGIVSITITKQSTTIAYSDMTDNASHYSALILAEKGILTGEKLGSEYFFRPDMPVTRGEFLAMCLAAGDADMLPGITRTGFYDDARIPMWVKPYVSTALMAGIISGFIDGDGQLVFAPEDPVTISEAAVILNNMMDIPDVVSVGAFSQEACPAWSQQAEQNLAACHILTPSEVRDCASPVTRAQAADMLVSAMVLLETRDTGHSLLDWLK